MKTPALRTTGVRVGQKDSDRYFDCLQSENDDDDLYFDCSTTDLYDSPLPDPISLVQSLLPDHISMV